MKKIIAISIVFFGIVIYSYAAPVSRLERNLLPETTSTFDLGTTTAKWKNVYTDNLNSTTATIGTLTIPFLANGPLIVGTTTVSAPDIYWQYDTNTGLGWLANDKQALYTGGTARLTIDASGNVGIGTSSPENLLHLQSSATTETGILRVYAPNMANNAGVGFWLGKSSAIDSAGTITFYPQATAANSYLQLGLYGSSGPLVVGKSNVGIGTSTPAAKLEIAGSAAAAATVPNLRFTDTAGNANSRNWLIGNGQGPYGGLAFDQSTSAGGDPTANTRMLIDYTGNVGIGTTSPSYLLDVAKNQNALTGIRVFNNTSGANAEADLIVDNGTYTHNFGIYSSATSYGAFANNQATDYTNSPAGIALMANNASAPIIFATGGNAEKVRIDSTGNVGIGTTTPGSWLQLSSGTSGTVFNEGLRVTRSATPLQYGMFNYNGGALNIVAVDANGGATPEIDFGLSTNGSSNSVKMVLNKDGNVGIGTTSPVATLGVNGLMYIGGAGTSTIQNNLYVQGTLRATNSYVGDLVFGNGMRFTEKDNDLLLLNKDGKTILHIKDNGEIIGDFGIDREKLKKEIKSEIINDLSFWDLLRKLFR